MTRSRELVIQTARRLASLGADHRAPGPERVAAQSFADKAIADHRILDHELQGAVKHGPDRHDPLTDKQREHLRTLLQISDGNRLPSSSVFARRALISQKSAVGAIYILERKGFVGRKDGRFVFTPAAHEVFSRSIVRYREEK